MERAYLNARVGIGSQNFVHQPPGRIVDTVNDDTDLVVRIVLAEKTA
jgi:hypothetical protein